MLHRSPSSYWIADKEARWPTVLEIEEKSLFWNDKYTSTMGDKKAFQDKIAEILRNMLPEGTVLPPLHDDTDLIDDIGLNSLDFLQFIIQLETAFDIEIDIEKFDLKYFKRLAELQVFIEEIVRKKDVA